MTYPKFIKPTEYKKGGKKKKSSGKPKPTNPSLWSRAKAMAKKKFDVYPSAYANGWAAKWYKENGGGWTGGSKKYAAGGPEEDLAKSGTEALLNALSIYDTSASPIDRRLQYKSNISDSREALEAERRRVQNVRNNVIPMSKEIAEIHKRITLETDDEGREALLAFERMLNPKGDTDEEKKAYLRREIKNAPKLLKDALPAKGAYNLFLINSEKYHPKRELYCTPYGCFAYQKAGAKDLPIVSGNFGLVEGIKSEKYPFEQVSFAEALPGDMALKVDLAPNDYRDESAGYSMRPHHTTILDTKYSPQKIDAYQADDGRRLEFRNMPLVSNRFDFYRYVGQTPKMEDDINYQQQAFNALAQSGAFNMDLLPSRQPTAISNPVLENRSMMPLSRTSYASFAMGGPTNPNELNMATVGDLIKPAEGGLSDPKDLSLTEKDKNLIQNSIKKAAPGISSYQLQQIYDNFFADEDSIPYTLNMLNSGTLDETVQLVLGNNLASKVLSGEKPGFGDVLSTLSGAKGDVQTTLINMGVPPEQAAEYLKAQAKQAGAPEENLGYIDRLGGKGWANPFNFFDYELPAGTPSVEYTPYYSFAAGGPITYQQGGAKEGELMKIQAGGTHEESKLGGVPMGMDADGNMTLVEEGETIRKGEDQDFVFSDRLRLTKQDAEEFGIDKKYVGKTFAEVSKKLESRSRRKNDPIDKQTVDIQLNRLEEAQEMFKKRKLAEAQEMYGGDQEEPEAPEGAMPAQQGPSPEQMAIMQAMAQGAAGAQGGQAPMMPPAGGQPPMMAYGGVRQHASGNPITKSEFIEEGGKTFYVNYDINGNELSRKEVPLYESSKGLNLAQASPVAANLAASMFMPEDYNAEDYRIPMDDRIITKQDITSQLQDINQVYQGARQNVGARAGSLGEMQALSSQFVAGETADKAKVYEAQRNQFMDEIDAQMLRNLEIAKANSDMQASVDAANKALEMQKRSLQLASATELSKYADARRQEDLQRAEIMQRYAMNPYLLNP